MDQILDRRVDSVVAQSHVVAPEPKPEPEPDQELEVSASLANELCGQKLHVDMSTSFPKWPKDQLNPSYERLKIAVDKVLQK